MPATVTWSDVQVDFDKLDQAGVYPPLDAAMEPIQSLISSRQYAPDVVKHFIKKISEMNTAFGKMIKKSTDEGARKDSLRRVVRQVEADYNQSNWTVENVTNAQNIYNFVFESVRKAVEEPKQNIQIPVVLPVMTQKEAAELDSGKITVTMPATYVADFQKFKALLKPGWLKNYGTSPEQWKPFDTLKHNIGQLMGEMLDKVQQNKGYQKPLVPHFLSMNNLNKNRAVLNYVRINGCFVVNDVISMWHPEIQRIYRTTLLDAFPSTIVLRIAPLNQSNLALNFAQPLISFLEQFQDLEFFKRMTSDYDLKCADMSASHELGRHVMNFTPDLIPPYDKVNSPLTGQIIGASTR